MDNAHLFELLYAGPALAPVKLMLMLVLAQLVSWLWPQPRPFATHPGTQNLVHGDDPSCRART